MDAALKLGYICMRARVFTNFHYIIWKMRVLLLLFLTCVVSHISTLNGASTPLKTNLKIRYLTLSPGVQIPYLAEIPEDPECKKCNCNKIEVDDDFCKKCCPIVNNKSASKKETEKPKKGGLLSNLLLKLLMLLLQRDKTHDVSKRSLSSTLQEDWQYIKKNIEATQPFVKLSMLALSPPEDSSS